MSPKPNVLEDMDVEISQVARGSTDLVPGPPATYGQDLAQVPPNEIAVT